MNILAIDPGNTESGWVIINAETRKPLRFDKTPNAQLLDICRNNAWILDMVAIEMIASYGMAVGAEVFDTCRWIGKFEEALAKHVPAEHVHLVKRQPIKLHHCHSAKATDANIAQALKDRFAYGQPNHGKGTVKAPGFFYGFKADVWQAYALAVYAADVLPRKAAA